MPRPEPRRGAVESFLELAPRELLDALHARGVTVTAAWREAARAYAHADGPEGSLFVRYSTDRRDRERLEHEVAARAAVGCEGALRAPRVLMRGERWMVEQRIEPGPWSGSAAVEVALGAATELMTIALPPGPVRESRRGERRARRLVRTARSTIGILRPTDLL